MKTIINNLVRHLTAFEVNLSQNYISKVKCKNTILNINECIQQLNNLKTKEDLEGYEKSVVYRMEVSDKTNTWLEDVTNVVKWHGEATIVEHCERVIGYFNEDLKQGEYPRKLEGVMRETTYRKIDILENPKAVNEQESIDKLISANEKTASDYTKSRWGL